jgi:hypothetical protein
MKGRFSLLLIVPLLSVLSGGCATNSAPPLESSLRAGFPSFTADSTPDAPNYYWMADSPLMNNNSAGITLFPQPGGSNGASSGNVIVQPGGAR